MQYLLIYLSVLWNIVLREYIYDFGELMCTWAIIGDHTWKIYMVLYYIICYLAAAYIIAYIIMQLHIIHQRPKIMIVYHMISEVIQNNLICIIRFHGIDIPIVFQWGCPWNENCWLGLVIGWCWMLFWYHTIFSGS